MVAADLGPMGELCPAGPPLALSSTAGLTPLAVLPLSSGRLGVLTDDATQPVRLFDADGPLEPYSGVKLALDGLVAPALAAWLDDDWLTVLGADDQLRQYRMPQPGTIGNWYGQRSLFRVPYLNPVPQTESPTARVRSGFLQPIAGYASGGLAVSYGPGTPIPVPLGQGPVLALAETHRTLLAATASGVYQVRWKKLEVGNELRSTASRWEGDTLHLGPDAIGFGGNPWLDFNGSGRDQNGRSRTGRVHFPGVHSLGSDGRHSPRHHW